MFYKYCYQGHRGQGVGGASWLSTISLWGWLRESRIDREGGIAPAKPGSSVTLYLKANDELAFSSEIYLRLNLSLHAADK